ncbi:MAG: helix-turn-helix transcriptional regulator [Actinomycetota bacterium]|nr:helix-turn-helix transcriptional regulator [Actinomycetota bacterium]
MNARERFASLVKERLLAEGFSYKKFGEEVGQVPHQTVSRWVNAQGLPEYDRLAAISKLLEIDQGVLHRLWVEAITERSRKVAGEPVQSSRADLNDHVADGFEELQAIKRRMAKLEEEVRKLKSRG